MAHKVALSTLNASTLDILNVIRENASLEYQQSIPRVTKSTDIRRVGEILVGAPALQNQFINALVNRIARVVVQSATFNNPYKILKKGYVEFGETIEDIFVGIADVIEYDADKGEQREFKRTIPNVHSIFHIMNWRVLYPVTIQKDDLKRAFLSMDGVTDLITKIVEQVYTSAEYDEFLLFKYLIIKSISKGGSYPVGLGNTSTNAGMLNAAKQFRAYSNKLTFMSDAYNEANVSTTTPKDRQIILMDADFNAQFDVEVLASAFNMEKADFMGRLFLIDDFTSFDNKRFAVIRDNSDMLEEVTEAELALLANIKAILADENWFQVYDNENEFTEKYVASGLYWNYFYHTWKTISYSPFANFISFVEGGTTAGIPNEFSVRVASKDVSDFATVITLTPVESDNLSMSNVHYVQTENLTASGIAIQPYGAVIIPATAYTGANAGTLAIDLVATINGVEYKVTKVDIESEETITTIDNTITVGTAITFTKVSNG